MMRSVRCYMRHSASCIQPPPEESYLDTVVVKGFTSKSGWPDVHLSD